MPILQLMSGREDIAEGVGGVFTGLFPELKHGSYLKKKQSDIPAWDSFAHMQLVAALEERFGIRIHAEEAVDLDSAQKCIALVRRKSRKGREEPLPMPHFGNFSEALSYRAAHAPSKLFLIDVTAGEKYAYAAFNGAVNRAARFLKEKGVRRGDIVSVRIRNSSEFLIIYFATIRIGGVINPVPSTISDAEFGTHLEFVRPRLVCAETVPARLRKRHRTALVAFAGKHTLAAMLKKYSDAEVEDPLDPAKPACLYYSSGTTSNPKGVLYSHRNMTSLVDSICRDFGHDSETKHLGFLPMGHTAITNYSFLPVLYAGGTLVFAENFLKIRSSFWSIVKKYAITYVETVPTVLFSILNTKYPRYSKQGMRLAYVGCGSAPLPLSIQKKFQEKFRIPVANLYGLSETGPSHFDDPREKGWKPGSIGRPLSVNECRIVGGDLSELPRGSVGEIALKGPNVFIGYYKNTAAYRAAVRKGYFLTGDLGYEDSWGRFYYVDRKKDLIIKGGANIFPGEIDEVLFKHPAVLEASTIGIPDVFFGEEIVAFVTLKKSASEAELLAHCAKHLQAAKRPKRILIVPSLPKTASGKLLRRHLRTLYQEKYEK